MTTETRWRGMQIAVAAVAWFGVLLQLFLSLQLSLQNGKTIIFGVVIFFGFFTVVTNILVALVLTVPLLSPSSAGRFLARPGVRTATAAAIALVGIAYHMLLRSIWDPQGWQLLADVVLHYVTPLLYLLFWWFAVRKDTLRLRHIGAWITYPLAYTAYLLVRGELTGLYPYHFLDLPALGWQRVAVNALGVFGGFCVIAMALLAAGRLQLKRNR